MENKLLSLVLQIREQIRIEKGKYLKAIEKGNDLEAREIAERITRVQAELEKILPRSKGYQGL